MGYYLSTMKTYSNFFAEPPSNLRSQEKELKNKLEKRFFVPYYSSDRMQCERFPLDSFSEIFHVTSWVVRMQLTTI